jgi:hypothetical protein
MDIKKGTHCDFLMAQNKKYVEIHKTLCGCFGCILAVAECSSIFQFIKITCALCILVGAVESLEV